MANIIKVYDICWWLFIDIINESNFHFALALCASIFMENSQLRWLVIEIVALNWNARFMSLQIFFFAHVNLSILFTWEFFFYVFGIYGTSAYKRVRFSHSQIIFFTSIFHFIQTLRISISCWFSRKQNYFSFTFCSSRKEFINNAHVLLFRKQIRDETSNSSLVKIKTEWLEFSQ